MYYEARTFLFPKTIDYCAGREATFSSFIEAGAEASAFTCNVCRTRFSSSRPSL